jgi:hypothetical protein
MKFLFLFMDGVGLGKDDPYTNPFVRAELPFLDSLLEGNKLIFRGQPTNINDKQSTIHTRHASLIALDACLGVDGIPQSASGQASLLTGKNVSAILGYHDGPKPNPEIMRILSEGTVFSHIDENGGKVSLLNAYPPRYFSSIDRGYRLPGVIALSASYAGMQLKTKDHLSQGSAISTDFTAQGWHDYLGLPDVPLLTSSQAGERICKLSAGHELAFFEYWLTDIAGHQQDINLACELLTKFDVVLSSLVENLSEDDRLILITSDHGNLEDLSTRRHTRNTVPLLLIGAEEPRWQFINELYHSRGMSMMLNITHLCPTIIHMLKH